MEISVLKGNEYYSITDGVLAGLSGYTGTGLPPHHLIVDRSPYQHGEDYQDFRLDPREMSFILIVKDSGMSTLETRVRQLQALFQPRGLITMKFVTDSGDTRYAYVNYLDGLALEHAIGNGAHYKIPLTVRAHSPLFYTGSSTETAFNLGGAADGMIVPLPVPFNVGSSTADVTTFVIYAGTWRTYPIVTISGPITNCKITNTSTGDKLDFTGVTIASGSTYIVDCRSGFKTVKNGTGVSKLSDLTSDSDLATFSFWPDPDVVGGNNGLTITGTAISGVTEIVFTYDTLYTYL